MTKQVWTEVSTIAGNEVLLWNLMSFKLPPLRLKTNSFHIPSACSYWAFCSMLGGKVCKGSSLLYSCGHCRISSRCETPGMKRPWSTSRNLMTYLLIWRNSRAFLLCLIQQRPSASNNAWRVKEGMKEQKIFYHWDTINPLLRALLGTPHSHTHCWKWRPEPMETNPVYCFLLWNLITPKEFQQETSGFIRCLNGKRNKEITLCNRFMAKSPQKPGHLKHRQKTYL